MPTNQNDIIHLAPGAILDALAGDDLIFWSGGNAHVDGGADGFDSNPYQPFDADRGIATGDMVHVGGDRGVSVVWSDWNAGKIRMGGDTLTMTGIERVYGSAGNDTIRAGAVTSFGPDGHGISIFAGAGNDNIVGSRSNDVIDPGAGNDTVFAGNGYDFVNSSTGNDLVYGGAGDDNIRWGLGDAHWHNPGNDTIFGGDGHDLINVWVWDGGTSNGVGTPGGRVTITTIRADGAFAGTATVGTGDGEARLRFQGFELGWTHMGDDTLDASGARVMGGLGINWNGRWGDDRLIGSSGADTLVGDEGRDTIAGGAGNDALWIGRDRTADGDVDTIIFRAGDGQDTIYGFGSEDVLDLGGRDYHARETSAGTLLDLGGGDTILLAHVLDFV